MKIKTLLLSTVAAAGLSSAALAADPAALTSLDVCDALGISGLTISSDSNCLQISGEVKYEFIWGDFDATAPGLIHPLAAPAGAPGFNQDWSSKVDAWLKFVGTADSDFGPAKAVIKLKYDEDAIEVGLNAVVVTTTLDFDEAYVAVGDSTVLMAGKKGSIASLGHDKGYNWLGLRHDDFGVTGDTGGHVIQLTSDLGNGVDVGVGLEDLDAQGSLVGVLNYAGDTLAAHITIVADDILTGAITTWGVHAGAEVTVDMFKFLVAANFDSASVWNVVASAQATYDMFTLAASVYGNSTNGLEAAISATAAVTDTVTIKLAGRWDDHDTTVPADELWNVDAAVVAEVTENVTLTGAIGVQGDVALATTTAYGYVEAAWAPGGGFESSVKAEANANSAYKLTFKAKKSF